MVGMCRDRSGNCGSSRQEGPKLFNNLGLTDRGPKTASFSSMGVMNVNIESRRVVPNFHGAYPSKIKGASVYLHDQEVENAISESMFEYGSRPKVRHRDAPFVRFVRFFFFVAAPTDISAG